MKKNLKERITSLGLNYNKEILLISGIGITFTISALLIYFFLKEIYVSIAVFGLGVGAIFYYISRYSSLEKKKEKEHIDELISLLSYFEIFVSNGNNIYMSFKMLLPYCSVFMEEAINLFLNQVDVDKSVGPYINFASKFSNHTIESLMLSIYQMVDGGENINQFSEFDLLFTNIRSKFQDDLIESKKRSLESLNSLPLFGAGAITITLSMSIISIIGEFTNVL